MSMFIEDQIETLELVSSKFLINLPQQQYNIQRFAYHLKTAYYYCIDLKLISKHSSNKQQHVLYIFFCRIIQDTLPEEIHNKIKEVNGYHQQQEVSPFQIFRIIKFTPIDVCGAIIYRYQPEQFISLSSIQQSNKSINNYQLKNMKILMVQCINTKKLGFPKGKYNQKQSSVQCAIREVHQQTGLKILIHQSINPIKVIPKFGKVQPCFYCFCPEQQNQTQDICLDDLKRICCSKSTFKYTFFPVEITYNQYLEFLQEQQRSDEQSMQFYTKQKRSTEIFQYLWLTIQQLWAVEYKLTTNSRIAFQDFIKAQFNISLSFTSFNRKAQSRTNLPDNIQRTKKLYQTEKKVKYKQKSVNNQQDIQEIKSEVKCKIKYKEKPKVSKVQEKPKISKIYRKPIEQNKIKKIVGKYQQK